MDTAILIMFVFAIGDKNNSPPPPGASFSLISYRGVTYWPLQEWHLLLFCSSS